MTKEEILQLRLEVKRNEAEIELTEKLLQQKKRLNEIKKRKVESEKREFETTEKDCELQDKLENTQIRRVQKKKQNILRMKKALGIDTRQAKRIEAPTPAPVENKVINIIPVKSEPVIFDGNNTLKNDEEIIEVADVTPESESKTHNDLYYNDESEVVGITEKKN